VTPHPDPKAVNLVLYHKACADGFASAWAAWKVLGEQAEYEYVQYGDEAPDVTGKHVAIVDFSFPRDVIDRLAAQAASLIVLDHHKSAQEALHAHPSVVFNMNKSGAMLTWEWFHPGVPAPSLVEYVQDRDLWRWDLPDSKEISAMLKERKFDFNVWDEVAGHLDLAPDDWRRVRLVDEGRNILKFIDRLANGQAKYAVPAVLAYPSYVDPEEVKLRGDKAERTPGGELPVLVVNAPVLNSEICHSILDREDCEGAAACSWFYDHNASCYRISLRSRKGHPPVDIVARALGGGGHRNAAGCEVGGGLPLPLVFSEVESAP